MSGSVQGVDQTVRALRFNLYRGQTGDLDVGQVNGLVALATRAHAVAGWHAEV